MTAFAGKYAMAVSVPVHTAFTQTGTRGDERAVALLWFGWRQADQVRSFQVCDARCVSFKVVDEPYAGNSGLSGNLPRIDRPGKVGGLDPSVSNRSGDCQARRLN